jgi:hypothetical protein
MTAADLQLMHNSVSLADVRAADAVLDNRPRRFGCPHPMIDIRIVCTHDAVKLAEALTRLLEAEEHRVRLTYGRQALSALAEARTSRDAVLLIWSPDARSQTYMLEWARTIDPWRLVEIARIQDCPLVSRKTPVIDFRNWRGERGGRAWEALNDRLRGVARVLNPAKPTSPHALLAMGLASAAAITGAVVVRVNDVLESVAEETPHQEVVVLEQSGLGGPLNAIEPASLDDMLDFGPYADVEPLEFGATVQLADVPEIAPHELRDPTLLERLSALNPLRQPSNGRAQ